MPRCGNEIYAFGEEWREFKRVIIEFLEAHKQNDPVVLSRLFKYPLNVAVASRLHSDGTYGYSWHEVDDADDAVRYFSHVIEWPLSNGIARELYQIKHHKTSTNTSYTQAITLMMGKSRIMIIFYEALTTKNHILNVHVSFFYEMLLPRPLMKKY